MTSPTTTPSPADRAAAGDSAVDADALTGFRLDTGPLPDERGRFGQFGGMFVPEVLMPAALQVRDAWAHARLDAAFCADYVALCRSYVGRPTPLHDAQRLSADVGGARIVLKREDLAHTGAHKINNALGQALLARRLGKHRVVAETGAGQHGVATATACALLDLRCTVFMGEVDIERQAPNVLRMQLLGADIRPVGGGSRTLKDATNAAIREWVTHVRDTYYLIGSAVGMHPYPLLVRDLQSVVGHEARAQVQALAGALPSDVVACVGGGSNAIGTFAGFRDDAAVALHGAEAAGAGLATGVHAASIAGGSPGVLHGSLSMLLQDADGQVLPTHSVSAGLDYPGVGPEHAYLASTGRAAYEPVDDVAALAALARLACLEGIIPALESAHALALGATIAARREPDQVVLITVSGRGDKDLATVAAHAAAAPTDPT